MKLSQGFELETTWLPGANWVISFNMSLNDGEIKEFDDTQVLLADSSQPPAQGCTRADLTIVEVDACEIDRSSENLPRLPEETYFLAAQYNWETGIGTFIRAFRPA